MASAAPRPSKETMKCSSAAARRAPTNSAAVRDVMHQVMQTFDVTKYQSALDNNQQLDESELKGEIDILHKLRMNAKSKLWEMVVKFIDSKKRRTGYHNDAALLSFRAYLSSAFRVSDAHDVVLHKFLDSTLVEFHTVLHSMEGAIERQDEAALLKATSGHSLLSKLDVEMKLKDMKVPVKRLLWSWLKTWRSLAVRYALLKRLPPNLLLSIRAVAANLRTDFDNGKPLQLNPMDLAMQVMHSTDQNSKRAFTEQMKDGTVLTGIMDLLLEETSRIGFDISQIFNGATLQKAAAPAAAPAAALAAAPAAALAAAPTAMD